MKYLSILATVLLLISCSSQESPEAKAIRDYIELNTDNPKTYEPVETVPAEFENLYQLPYISSQLMNVENVVARVLSILDEINRTFYEIFTESFRYKLGDLLVVYEDMVLQDIQWSNAYIKDASDLLKEMASFESHVPSEFRQHYLENYAILEGATLRLQNEYNRLFGLFDRELLIKNFEELSLAISNQDLIVHKYRIEENGAPVLKAAIFMIKEGQDVNGVAIKVYTSL